VAGAASDQPALWAIGLSALLIAVGFARRSSEHRVSRRSTPGAEGLEEAEDGRGRSADTPSDIPASGWKDIVLRVFRGISEDRILLVAAGVTFYTLLSIFPGIAALISIYGLFADPSTVASQLDTVANVAPGGAIEVLRDEMTRLASRGGTTLGIGFLISLVISLWTANSGVSAIFDALNIVNEEKEERGLLRYYAATLTFTFGAVVFLLLAIALVVVLPVVLSYLPLPGGADLIVEIARWPIVFVLVALALAVLYRYGPMSQPTALAMDHLGQLVCRGGVARRICPFLVVRGQLWQLQQDLRLARCGRGLYDLDLDLHCRGSRRRQARCRDGASDGTRDHYGGAQAARDARRENGRHRRPRVATSPVIVVPRGTNRIACRRFRVSAANGGTRSSHFDTKRVNIVSHGRGWAIRVTTGNHDLARTAR
jgi:uncharacterized BrkB/YihY/UPF0761 family membrane protein